MSDFYVDFVAIGSSAQIGQCADSTNFWPHVNIEDLLNYDEVAFKQMGWDALQIRRWFQPEMKFIEPALSWAEKEGHHLIHCFQMTILFYLNKLVAFHPYYL